MSEFIPNSFQTPNAYVDRFIPFLTDAETRVLIYTARRIFGFQKRQDRISISQYVNGLTRENGERLDYGCGVKTRGAVIAAIESLIGFGLMVLVSENDPHRNLGAEYALQLDSEKVDMDGLQDRAEATRAQNTRRTASGRTAALEKQAREKQEPVCGTDQGESVGQTRGVVCGTDQGESVGQTGRGLSDRPGLVCGTDSQNTDRNPVLNTEGKPEEEGLLLLPATPKEAYEHPLLKIFLASTGILPGEKDYRVVIETVYLLRSRFADEQALIDYLKKFWLAWSGRKSKNGQPYGKFNLTWLTEWAVNDYIPPARGGSMPEPVPGESVWDRARRELVDGK